VCRDPHLPVVWVGIPGELDAFVVRVVEVDGLVRGVVFGPVYGPAAIQQTLECDSEIPARGVVDGEVVEAGRARGGWVPARTLPPVQTGVGVVTPPRQGGGAGQVADDLKAECIVVELDCSLQISDPEMHMPDACLSRDARSSCLDGGGGVCHG